MVRSTLAPSMLEEFKLAVKDAAAQGKLGTGQYWINATKGDYTPVCPVAHFLQRINITGDHSIREAGLRLLGNPKAFAVESRFVSEYDAKTMTCSKEQYGEIALKLIDKHFGEKS